MTISIRQIKRLVGKRDECVGVAGANNKLWVTWEHGSGPSGFSLMGPTFPHLPSHHPVSATSPGHLQGRVGRWNGLGVDELAI